MHLKFNLLIPCSSLVVNTNHANEQDKIDVAIVKHLASFLAKSNRGIILCFYLIGTFPGADEKDGFVILYGFMISFTAMPSSWIIKSNVVTSYFKY